MKTTSTLPKGVIASDLKYPSYKSNDQIDHDVGDYGTLTFHEVKTRSGSLEWYITTLLISRNRRYNGLGDRTYAVRVSDGQLGRIGMGPHVKRTIRVYVRKSRTKALQRYINLYESGAEEANQVRDRISSRRAQGQIERAQGHHYWRWNV